MATLRIDDNVEMADLPDEMLREARDASVPNEGADALRLPRAARLIQRAPAEHTGPVPTSAEPNR